MSNRIEKVNSLLEREIGKIILKEFYFPGTMVTLTHVESTSNLIEAKVFISAFPDEKIDEIVTIFNKNVYGIQQKINRLLRMRPIPKIKFVKDRDMSKAGRIEELLGQLKKEEK